MRCSLRSLWPAAIAAACSGSEAIDDPDAGARLDTGISVARTEPELPAAPALPSSPMIGPCSAGWREVPASVAGGVAVCDPAPAGGFSSCAHDEAHFPGEAGCVRIGSRCTENDWADGLPEGVPVLHAKIGAARGGTGTSTAPFATIGEAIAAAVPGTIVAISKGTFDEELRLPEGVTLWGACVAETVLTSSVLDPYSGVVTVIGENAVIRNLQLTGERIGVSAEASRVSVHLENVLIARTHRVGVLITELASASAHGVVVRDTQPTSEGRLGWGVNVLNATMDIHRAVFSDNFEGGIGIEGPAASIAVSDTIVRDSLGHGMVVAGGARAELRRAVFERNGGLGDAFNTGILVSGATSSITAEEIVIRDEPTAAPLDGLLLQDGARASVSRALFEGMTRGIFATGASSATFRDLVVRDTRSPLRFSASYDVGGRALELASGAEVTVQRGLFERNEQIAIHATSSTTLTLEDITVRETQPLQRDGTAGLGLVVAPHSTATVRRALFDRTRSAGIYAGGPQTSVAISDLVVRFTQSQEKDGKTGHGLELVRGVRATVTRALFEANREVAILVTGENDPEPTSVHFEDLLVRDTQSQEALGLYGRGLYVLRGASVRVDRGLFLRNREVSISAFEPGTTVVLEDVLVQETRPRACAVDDCIDFGAGHGIVAMNDASISASRFIVSSNALAGVMLAHGGVADLRDGEISSNVVGVSLQTAGFDVDRLSHGVIYRDNGRNLNAETLPVPDVAEVPLREFDR